LSYAQSNSQPLRLRFNSQPVNSLLIISFSRQPIKPEPSLVG